MSSWPESNYSQSRARLRPIGCSANGARYCPTDCERWNARPKMKVSLDSDPGRLTMPYVAGLEAFDALAKDAQGLAALPEAGRAIETIDGMRLLHASLCSPAPSSKRRAAPQTSSSRWRSPSRSPSKASCSFERTRQRSKIASRTTTSPGLRHRCRPVALLDGEPRRCLASFKRNDQHLPDVMS
jgi:hypothetical protein